jgi:hypothetical protein
VVLRIHRPTRPILASRQVSTYLDPEALHDVLKPAPESSTAIGFSARDTTGSRGRWAAATPSGRDCPALSECHVEIVSMVEERDVLSKRTKQNGSFHVRDRHALAEGFHCRWGPISQSDSAVGGQSELESALEVGLS